MSHPASGGGWPDPSTPQPGPPQDPYAGAYPPNALPGPVPDAPVYPAAAYSAPPGAPGYGMGYPQYAYLPPPKTNGLAIAGMVISIIAAVGLCGYGFGGLLGALGAVFGHVARRQIRERGEGGDGMALAGIIVGWIAFALGALIVAALVVFVWWAVTAA